MSFFPISFNSFLSRLSPEYAVSFCENCSSIHSTIGYHGIIYLSGPTETLMTEKNGLL